MNKIITVILLLIGSLGALLGTAAFILHFVFQAEYSKCCQLERGKEGFKKSTMPIYITSLNRDGSFQRFAAQKKILEHFNIGQYLKNPALHWKYDTKIIAAKYPMLNQSAERFQKRPGAYGLTASFLQFLSNGRQSTNSDYNGGAAYQAQLVGWMEDDVIPAGSESQFNKNQDIIKQINSLPVGANIVNKKNRDLFNNKYIEVINNLPVTQNDVYFFGHTNYCRDVGSGSTSSASWKRSGTGAPDKIKNKYWIKISPKDYYIAGGPGTSFILFSKDSINAIYQWVNKNIIDLPIDMLLMKLIKEEVITGWEVNDNISSNPMFYGFFEQFGTYCSTRQNNTIDN